LISSSFIIAEILSPWAHGVRGFLNSEKFLSRVIIILHFLYQCCKSLLLSICFALLKNDKILNYSNDDHFNSHFFRFFLFTSPRKLFSVDRFWPGPDFARIGNTITFPNCYCFIFRQSKSISCRIFLEFFSKAQDLFSEKYFGRSLRLLSFQGEQRKQN
jgi:hypothetical protein